MESRHSRRWFAMAAIGLCSLALGFDATILNLAIPTLAEEFSASSTQIQWFISSYILALSAMMLPAGMIGDRFGRKVTMLSGLAIFAAGSVVAAFASNSGMFILGRVILGIGGAAVVPMALASINVMFPAEERQKAISVLMGATLIGYPVGPILGGWMLDHLWWGWVILVNVPIGLLAFVAIFTWMPESRGDHAPTIDWLGILLSSAGASALVYGFINVGEEGWGDALSIILLAVAIALLAAFVVWERNIAHPLLDVSVFTKPLFSTATGLLSLIQFAMFGVLFLLPQYLQVVLDYDALGSGVRLLAMIAGFMVGSIAVNVVTDRISPRMIIGFGFLIMALGFWLASRTDMASGTGEAILWSLITGVGMGTLVPVLMNHALAAIPEEQSAIGSAAIQAIRQLAGSFGAAVLGSVLSLGYRNELDLSGLPEDVQSAIETSAYAGVSIANQMGSDELLRDVQGAFINGANASYLLCGIIAVVAAFIGWFIFPRSSGN